MGSSSLFVFKNIFFEGLESELLTYRRGRIALKGRANFNSPTSQFAHIAKFTHVANSPMFSIALNGWANCNSPLHVRYPNVGKYYMQIASRAWHEDVCVRRRGELQFAHVAIHPYCKFIPYCKIHPRCKIHPHFKFTHVEGLIAISPYACVFWTFTNIHVNTQKSITGMV